MVAGAVVGLGMGGFGLFSRGDHHTPHKTARRLSSRQCVKSYKPNEDLLISFCILNVEGDDVRNLPGDGDGRYLLEQTLENKLGLAQDEKIYCKECPKHRTKNLKKMLNQK